jgi:hypothetical protein
VQSAYISSLSFTLAVEYLRNGFRPCQESFFTYFQSSNVNDVEIFFKSLFDRIEIATTIYNKELFKAKKVNLEDIDDNKKRKNNSKNMELGSNPICELHTSQLFQTLQLLCEGHYAIAQECMLGQSVLGVKKSYCILNQTIELLKVFNEMILLPNARESTSVVIISIMEFLVECVQGPCKTNQNYLVEYLKDIGGVICGYQRAPLSESDINEETFSYADMFTSTSREIRFVRVRNSSLRYKSVKKLKILLAKFVLSLLEGRVLSQSDNFTTAIKQVFLRSVDILLLLLCFTIIFCNYMMT